MAVKINTSDAVTQIDLLIKEFKKLQGTAGSSHKSLKELQAVFGGLGGKINITKKQYDNLKKSQLSYITQTKKAKAEVTALTDRLKRQNAEMRRMQAQSKRTGNALGRVFNSVKSLISAFGVLAGVQLFANVIKNSYDLIKVFDSLTFAMETVFKTQFKVAQSQSFLISLNKQFGAGLLTTTNRWIKFRAAAEQSGLSLKSTQDIFRSMTKASAVLGLQTDELRGVYLALEQMLSKGKITTEELRRQLGERLPGAMGIMAASMGKTIPELDKMLKKGQVLSAEVLPGFAKAVEAAFGTETLDRIDTVVAGENRMISAWQLLIKTITEGDSAVNSFFKNTLEGLTKGIELLTYFAGDDEQRVQMVTVKTDVKEAEKLKDDALRKAEERRVKQKRITQAEVQVNIDAAKKDLALMHRNKTLYKDRIKIVEEFYNENLQLKLDYLKENEEIERDNAILNERGYRDDVDRDKKAFEDKSKAYDEVLKRGNKIKDFLGKPISNLPEVLSIFTPPTAEERMAYQEYKMAMDEYAESLSRLRAATNSIDTDKVIPPDPDTARKKGFKSSINDLTNEEKIARLKLSIQADKVLIESEQIGYEERIELANKMAEKKHKINQIHFDEAKEQADKNFNRQSDKLAKAKADDTVIIENYTGEVEAIQKQHNDAMLIATWNQAKKVTEVQQQQADDLEKIQQDNLNLKLEASDKVFNDELIAENEAYAKGKTTWEKYQRARTEILREQAIARYEIQIKELEIELGKDGISKERTAEILQLIAKIKAGIQGLKSGGGGDVTDVDILGIIKEQLQGISDLTDAIFERRIEYINAEIEAEEEKYDKFIKLAENDESKKHALELQREARIDALEKRRLKEKQKQAKAEKAFAIADIAIKTAIAVMTALGTPFPLGQVLAASAAAMGAVQIATVLATPIPQYKDGLENAKTDHTAMINDDTKGGKMVQEYVERDGQILTTKTKNAIVNLKKGDTVHKDYDSMNRNAILISSMVNGNQLNERDFNMLSDAITNSLDKGLNKFKVNNNIRVNTNNNSNSYGESLSYWN